jgi:enamine deaminase RidA (YjgF/YER057c/UK114 family)
MMKNSQAPISDNTTPAVEPLLPVAIPRTEFRLARGIRAGRWLFASGQAATDYVNGTAPEVVQAHHPLEGESVYKRESRRIYANVKEVLAEAGAGIGDVIRLDQYYTTERAMHPYHEVRREIFGSKIPPSTSNLHQRFSRTDQSIEIQVAVVPGAGTTVKHESFRPSYDISAVLVTVRRLVPATSASSQVRPPRRCATTRVRSTRPSAIHAPSGGNGRSSSRPTLLLNAS